MRAAAILARGGSVSASATARFRPDVRIVLGQAQSDYPDVVLLGQNLGSPAAAAWREEDA